MAVKGQSHDTRLGGGFSPGFLVKVKTSCGGGRSAPPPLTCHQRKCQATDRRVIEVNLRANGERLRAPTWPQRGFRFILRRSDSIVSETAIRKKSGANVYLRGFVLPSGTAVVFSDTLLSLVFDFVPFLCVLLKLTVLSCETLCRSKSPLMLCSPYKGEAPGLPRMHCTPWLSSLSLGNNRQRSKETVTFVKLRTYN